MKKFTYLFMVGCFLGMVLLSSCKDSNDVEEKVDRVIGTSHIGVDMPVNHTGEYTNDIIGLPKLSGFTGSSNFYVNSSNYEKDVYCVINTSEYQNYLDTYMVGGDLKSAKGLQSSDVEALFFLEMPTFIANNIYPDVKDSSGWVSDTLQQKVTSTKDVYIEETSGIRETGVINFTLDSKKYSYNYTGYFMQVPGYNPESWVFFTESNDTSDLDVQVLADYTASLAIVG